MGLFTRLGTLSLALAALLSVGCGPAKLSGTVKFSDGTPLTKGTVVFSGETAQLTAGIQTDGSYTATADKIPSETYKVFLSGPIFGAEEEEAADDGGGDPDEDDGADLYTEDTPLEESEALVDRKFSSGETSGLTYSGGAGSYDIVVEKP